MVLGEREKINTVIVDHMVRKRNDNTRLRLKQDFLFLVSLRNGQAILGPTTKERSFSLKPRQTGKRYEARITISKHHFAIQRNRLIFRWAPPTSGKWRWVGECLRLTDANPQHHTAWTSEEAARCFFFCIILCLGLSKCQMCGLTSKGFDFLSADNCRKWNSATK